jgi:peroxiredoxin
MKSFLLLAILLLSFTFAVNAQHEYAPLQEREIKYKNWTYKSIRDGKEMSLLDLARDKKLVMVVYFAAWCPNWRNEAPFAQKLYDKYKANGLEVVGVSEYASIDEAKKSLNDFKITFPVVVESVKTEAKQKTTHYDYRKTTGDTRNWGSPWNIFLEPARLETKSDALTEKAFVVNGELIENEVEKFVREKLGLPAEEIKAETSAKVIENCEPEKKELTLKKP